MLCATALLAAVAAPAAAAALPDGRAYELVTPADLLGGAALRVFDSEPGTAQPWNAVASDGSGVLWSTRSVIPGIDSTGTTDTYLARRDPSGWASSYAMPPSSKMLLPPVAVWATADLGVLVWKVFGATIDPADQDPVATSSPQAFQDLYRREAGKGLARLTQGSLAPPATSEFNILTGVSSDGYTTVFTGDRQLEAEGVADSGIYQRSGQTTRVVNKDENGALVTPAIGRATSDDGNIVLFDTANTSLYLRNVRTAHTVHVVDSPAGDLGVVSLSADGSKAFFVSYAPLTADDVDASIDLYEYDGETSAVTRVSVPNGAAGGAGPGNTDSCAPAGTCDVAPVAVSRDGSKAYFVSQERLDGTQGTDGAQNLYLSERGVLHFVATLDPGDSVSDERFTPDGTKLIFESRAQITEYDNAGHTEIYVHDPSSDSISCASCRPSGAPPTGDASLRNGPGAVSPEQFTTAPLSPANSDEHGRRIYFHSTDAIVSQDTNGRYDVYEHTMSTGSTALISTGLSPNDSVYLGNGVDGKDVFFFTTESLVPQDLNGNVFKIYDARVGGGFSVPVVRPECVGEGCRGPAGSTPLVAQPGTGLAAPSSRTKQPAGASFAPSSKLTVSGVKSVKGTRARLTAKVSGAGRLRASGPGATPLSVATKRAAAYHLTVRLSSSAARRLRHTHRVNVTVTVRFSPSIGAPRSVRVPMTFSTASTKKGR